MGSELGISPASHRRGGSEKDSPLFSLTNQFYEVFPFYLSIGMTYDQFWNDDCTLVKYYRKAHDLKLKQRNQELWLQGLYIYEALCDVSPIFHAFAKPGTGAKQYVKEPYPISASEIAEKKKQEEELHFRQMESKMNIWAAKVNAQIALNRKKEVSPNG